MGGGTRNFTYRKSNNQPDKRHDKGKKKERRRNRRREQKAVGFWSSPLKNKGKANKCNYANLEFHFISAKREKALLFSRSMFFFSLFSYLLYHLAHVWRTISEFAYLVGIKR